MVRVRRRRLPKVAPGTRPGRWPFLAFGPPRPKPPRPPPNPPPNPPPSKPPPQKPPDPPPGPPANPPALLAPKPAFAPEAPGGNPSGPSAPSPIGPLGTPKKRMSGPESACAPCASPGLRLPETRNDSLPAWDDPVEGGATVCACAFNSFCNSCSASEVLLGPVVPGRLAEPGCRSHARRLALHRDSSSRRLDHQE